uniref:Uncharacterized protein n=1 Tax=Oryza brachyantha TaxID=4533 RepID=J3N520_ORYBR
MFVMVAQQISSVEAAAGQRPRVEQETHCSVDCGGVRINDMRAQKVFDTLIGKQQESCWKR